MRRAAVATFMLLGGCGSCRSSATSDAGATTTPEAEAKPSAVSAPLSLPIAADHDRAGAIYVAGLVAARGVVNLSRFEPPGMQLVWSVDVLDSLTYSSDAHIDVVGAARGAVVVWRGLRDGKRTRVGRYIGGDGKPATAPFTIGSSACTVSDTLFSIGGKGGGALMARHLPDGADQSVFNLPEGEPTLVCSDGKRALVVEEGEDDLSVRAVENGKALSRAVLFGPDDFGDDELREHEDFTTGDVLGELALTEKGRLMVRQYGEGVSATKRTLDHVVGPDEDLMAADGTATRVVALLSREANARCDGDLGTDVLAVDLSLTDPAAKERVVDIAHGECGRDLGPYWVAPSGEWLGLAWAVRGPRSGARAPVEALAWATLGEPAKTIPLSAEDIVFAGCNAGHCSFATLARLENTDGMAPGEARIVTIP